ncbi:restriction endonuclease subunit S [Methanoculleus sp.]|uniref:restriction endonuclease subunit S n=1 Tax=Methanoculleus sp. TaxID=90427 RepID=UPI0025D443C1|nr:restriction endonuclease subunit S [Methanoculleus sp.]MCK9319696.1 restriction endonuclease subunit S [Methanoculleus sp.]
MAAESIKLGYKLTEVGIIPEDWEVKKLGEISKITMGQSPKSINYNLKEIGLPLVQGNADIENRKSIIRNYSSEITKKSYKNDIIMTVRAPVGEIAKAEFDCCIGRGVCSINYENDYLYQKLIFLESFWKKVSRGSTFDSVNLNEVKEILISLPKSSAEQLRIAQVLLDTDLLIESLDKLIEKKKNIKQGAMQELLTGKRRLSGCKRDWKNILLKEICKNIKTGKLDANAMIEDGEYRFYTCAKDYYLINNFAFDTEALLISGNGANVGYIHYYKGKFNAYQRTYVLSDFLENIFFIKYYLDKNLRERITVEVNAGNTPYITMDTLSEMQINLPSTKEEQSAIAEIIFDMDSEIEQLEKEREKYKKIKIGMMQELLTGRIRLK